MERVAAVGAQGSVVIFTLSTCCMCHAVKRLFHELGANPMEYELDKDANRVEMETALVKLLGRHPPVPAVFIGGAFIGTTDAILTMHLSGNLVPLLRGAGAIRAQ